MADYTEADTEPELTPKAHRDPLRNLAVALGMLLMVVGLICGIMVFCAVWGALREPQLLGPMFAALAEAVGGAQLDLATADSGTLHLAYVLAVAVAGGGVVVLTWIAIRLMLTGGEVVWRILEDLGTVKKALTDAVGLTHRQRSRKSWEL